MHFKQILRSKPQILPVQLNLNFSPVKILLDNGLTFHEIFQENQKISKMEWVFPSGRIFEKKKLIARCTADLLRAGNAHCSSQLFAEKIDFWGAHLRINEEFDQVRITCFCLHKYTWDLFDFIMFAIKKPIFEIKEFENYIRRKKQALEADLQKSDNISYRTLTEKIFGAEHPYGYNSFPADYDFVERDDIFEHHSNYFHGTEAHFFLVGSFNEELSTRMKGCLNQLSQSCIDNKKHIVDFPLQPVKLQLRKPQKSEQASIRLGRILVPKNHADYPALFFVNLILGGYFGSRLMQNIREQNALTYNIYSTVETVLHSGYFQLSTEVHHKKVDQALKEIYAEIEKMYLEKVTESELKMVKNYYFGQVLSATDGIFNLSKLYREWTCAQLDFEHFHQFLDEIININSELVANISEKYLKIEYLSEIVVD